MRCCVYYWRACVRGYSPFGFVHTASATVGFLLHLLAQSTSVRKGGEGRCGLIKMRFGKSCQRLGRKKLYDACVASLGVGMLCAGKSHTLKSLDVHGKRVTKTETHWRGQEEWEGQVKRM